MFRIWPRTHSPWARDMDKLPASRLSCSSNNNNLYPPCLTSRAGNREGTPGLVSTQSACQRNKDSYDDFSAVVLAIRTGAHPLPPPLHLGLLQLREKPSLATYVQAKGVKPPSPSSRGEEAASACRIGGLRGCQAKLLQPS